MYVLCEEMYSHCTKLLYIFYCRLEEASESTKMVCSRYILVSLLVFPILVNGKFLLFNPFKRMEFPSLINWHKFISVVRVVGVVYLLKI